MKVNYRAVDDFVTAQTSKGSDLRWEGWDLVHFSPHLGGFHSGVYRNGEYGFETRVEVNVKGYYIVPDRVVIK